MLHLIGRRAIIASSQQWPVPCGLAVDWPITYDDLEPWYCEAERELGVADDSTPVHGEPRSQSYPLPAIPMTYLDRRVADALAGSGHV